MGDDGFQDFIFDHSHRINENQNWLNRVSQNIPRRCHKLQPNTESSIAVSTRHYGCGLSGIKSRAAVAIIQCEDSV